MLLAEDFNTLVSHANEIFASLPQEARFFYKWFKATVTPGGRTYDVDAVFEAVPALIMPKQSESQIDTTEGNLVIRDGIEIIIPKRFGETLELEDVTYTGGIQINDRLQDQDGKQFRVEAKQSRGYGAYYLLSLENEEGYEYDWFDQGQV